MNGSSGRNGKVARFAIGSTISCPGDIEANLKQIARFAGQAAGDGVDLLLTPELSATGYGSYPDVLALAEKAGEGRVYHSLAEVSMATGVILAAGFCEKCGDKRFISHYVVYPDGRFLAQRKHRVMPNERPFDDPYGMHPWYDSIHSGQPLEVKFEYFLVGEVKCALVICADYGILRLNEILQQDGVDVLLVPTGAGGSREDRLTLAELALPKGMEKFDAIMSAITPGKALSDCIRYGRAQVAVNICGYDGREYYHGGNGSIINMMGELVAYLPFLPVLERQRPLYAHALIDVREKIRFV